MKKYLLLIISLFDILQVNAQTYVSGGIYNNTTWTLANSPYIVQDSLTLFQGKTLTIEPGVIVKFEDWVGFDIRGTINAIGTVSDTIVFTSASALPSQGSWYGFFSHPELGASLNLKYCCFRYSFYAVEFADGANTAPASNIIHCSFDQNTAGINYAHVGTVAVDSCYFSNNYFGIGTAVTGYTMTLTNSIFQNNKYALYEVGDLYPTNCTFCSNKRASVSSNVHFVNCNIINNNVGIFEDQDNITTTITNSIIADNDTGIVLRPGSSTNDSYSGVTVCGNHIYDVVHSGVYSPDLSNFCWCESDSFAIATSIYDGYDNSNLGLIQFTPFTNCSIDISACSAVVGIQNPLNHSFVHIFPNPFTTSITFQFNLTSSSQTLLQVFDMNDRLIQTPFQTEVLSTGMHTINFDVGNLPGGMYYYVLRCNEKVEVGKMVLEK